MKFKLYTLWVVSIIMLIGCSAPREAVMPHRNVLYIGSRGLPIKNNDTEFTFRVWMNNSTSIERVITVSSYKSVVSDTLMVNYCSIVEFGSLYQKGMFKEKEISHYSKVETVPFSGFDEFRNKLDSLNLMDLKDQQDDFSIALHDPFSLYIIEIKDLDRYNSFRFFTHAPIEMQENTIYDEIQNLIFDEFPIEYKMK